MCGRYTLRTNPGEFASLFDAVPQFLPDGPRYNVAPSQTVPVVTAAESGRTITAMKWGLIPAKTTKPKFKPINAKCETAATKWPFSYPYKRNRCLVPADGFFEWLKADGQKLPYCFQRADGEPFAFAGLWDRNEHIADEPVDTFTVLTTRANELMAPIHDRMPVMLDRCGWDKWLDPQASERETAALFEPFPSERMVAFQVSQVVNTWKNDIPECVEPIKTE